jgi:hypothetical protein
MVRRWSQCGRVQVQRNPIGIKRRELKLDGEGDKKAGRPDPLNKLGSIDKEQGIGRVAGRVGLIDRKLALYSGGGNESSNWKQQNRKTEENESTHD